MKRWVRMITCLVLLFSTLPTFANHDPIHIRIVYADNWKPISYREDGIAKGLLPEKMEHILSNYSDLTIEHIAVPWARAQQMVKNGQAEGMVTTATPSRLEYTFKSENSVFLLPFVAVTHKSDNRNSDFSSPDDLSLYKDEVFCDVLGNGWAEVFYKDKPVAVHTAPTIKECLKLLVNKRVDGVIHAKPVVRLYAQELGLIDELVIHNEPSIKSPVFPLLVSKKAKAAKKIVRSFDKHFWEDHETIYLD